MVVKKAIGQRGSWFAKVDDEALPCVHRYWLKGLMHHDPFIRHQNGHNADKIREFVDAVADLKRVIVTDDEPKMGSGGYPVAFTRKGYVAAYDVEDVSYSVEDGLKFRLTKRVYDLV